MTFYILNKYASCLHWKWGIDGPFHCALAWSRNTQYRGVYEKEHYHICLTFVAFPYVVFLTSCWMFHKKNRSWWWQISTDFKKWYFPLNFAYFFWWIILLLSLKVFVSMDGQKMQHKVTQHLLNSCNLSCSLSDNVWVAEILWLKYCFADSFCQNGTRPWVDRKVFMAKRMAKWNC